MELAFLRQLAWSRLAVSRRDLSFEIDTSVLVLSGINSCTRVSRTGAGFGGVALGRE